MIITKESMESTNEFIGLHYWTCILEWYNYFNHSDSKGFRKTFLIMNDETLKDIDVKIQTLISTGVEIKNNQGNEHNQKYELCNIAYRISQLNIMKGIILAFSKKDRNNSTSKELFYQALKYARRAVSQDYNNPYLTCQISFLFNELDNKREAIVAFQGIQHGDAIYHTKLYYINEIMYDLCFADRYEYRKLMYNPQAKIIPKLSNREEGFFQDKARWYYNLSKDERNINALDKIKSDIDAYALRYGFTHKDAHDVICRNLYVTKHESNGELSKFRLLFWELYAEETIPLFLRNT